MISLKDAGVIERVTIAFAPQSQVGGGVFPFGGDSGADGEGAEDHDEGAADDEQAVGRVGVGQLAEDESAPRESPELVGIGERNAAADAEILGCVLLKDVADDPDESAEEEPEEHVADFGGMEDGGVRTAIERQHKREEVPSSPTVKTVTKESGFMPLR